MKFPLVLHTDDGTRYGVAVPDLPGCFSAGDTFEEALESAKEAITLHLEGLTEDGSPVPLPRPIAEHQKNPDYANGVWAIIDIDVSRFDGRTEKINITVPRRMLAQIDRYAKAHGATRSGFLVEAARRAMQNHR
ncbi:type II toxin-antitoxin system HicB family antitoxin [Castellaniella caeni]|uniref:type II toxin-antitoxin system HicB family antitoxin n=1 Tax=Castellaniella caeni TaxID=266123 RepID=UPI000C9FA6AA|nr:type II toxin-antitoxin system HicB family antitoxin [Castellaniella caeni]